MSRISAHVLDTSLGSPARALRLVLAVLDGRGEWIQVSERLTDDDGRAPDLLGGQALEARTYRITFETGAYLAAAQRPVFYPRVDVVFRVERATEHHHVPLLLSPFGYTTYRGS